MYFRHYGLRKTWLDKCQKKSRLREPFEKLHGKWVGRPLKS